MQHHIIKSLFTLFVAACLPAISQAQYFESGGIGYNVLSATEHTVEVWPLQCAFYRGNINIPATVTYNGTTYDVVALGKRAFYGATLSSVTIPSSVTQIKYGCFLFATGPSSITVPASVIDIGTLAFAANNMTTINVDENNPNYRSIGGILFSKDTSTVVECPMKKSGTITLPQNTKHIAPDAFAYCQTLTGVTLPDSLLSIGEAAFLYANHLNSIAIPASVSHIGNNLFGGCSALNNLSLAEGNSHYYLDGKAIYSAGGDTLVSYHKSTDSVFLPGTLRVVSGFNSNSDVRYVHVPDGVTKISDNAFGNSSLMSIDLPNELSLIDEYAFYYCESLTHVGMPAALGYLGEGCFEACSNLPSIVIPNGISTIPEEAFYFCESLSQITWGDDVAVIDSFAFGGCAFTEIQLPPTLHSVRMGAFEGYDNGRLQTVIFTAPVDTVEPEAFTMQPLHMLRFKNTVPPVTVTSLEYGADYGCLYMADVDTIVVPCGSLNAWLADSYWSQFADLFVEDCNMGIGNPGNADVPVRIYAHNGRIIVEGAEGETIRIFDITGRQLFNYKNQSSKLTHCNNLDFQGVRSLRHEIQSSQFPTGVYLVKVGDRPARKVVVIR